MVEEHTKILLEANPGRKYQYVTIKVLEITITETYSYIIFAPILKSFYKFTSHGFQVGALSIPSFFAFLTLFALLPYSALAHG